jgi:hypothetical protein
MTTRKPIIAKSKGLKLAICLNCKDELSANAKDFCSTQCKKGWINKNLKSHNIAVRINERTVIMVDHPSKVEPTRKKWKAILGDSPTTYKVDPVAKPDYKENYEKQKSRKNNSKAIKNMNLQDGYY